MRSRRVTRFANRGTGLVLAALACYLPLVMPDIVLADTASDESIATQQAEPAPVPKPPLDRSGRKRVGKASVYAERFAGRKMADGSAMQSESDNAASNTLPLGTTAKVTNLRTGQSAVVTIRDRGPYVKGRIVDLSPSTAQQIGIGKAKGVAKVEVAPIAVPLADGSIKAGAGDTDSTPEKSVVSKPVANK